MRSSERHSPRHCCAHIFARRLGAEGRGKRQRMKLWIQWFNELRKKLEGSLGVPEGTFIPNTLHGLMMLNKAKKYSQNSTMGRRSRMSSLVGTKNSVALGPSADTITCRPKLTRTTRIIRLTKKLWPIRKTTFAKLCLKQWP